MSTTRRMTRMSNSLTAPFRDRTGHWICPHHRYSRRRTVADTVSVVVHVLEAVEVQEEDAQGVTGATVPSQRSIGVIKNAVRLLSPVNRSWRTSYRS